MVVTFGPRNHRAGPWTLHFLYAVVEDRVEWVGLTVERAEGKHPRPLEHQVFRSIRFSDLADRGRRRLLREHPELLPKSQSRLEGLPALSKPRQDEPTHPRRYAEDHYADVTETYLRAWRRNDPPTRAVAEHFRVPHSTASKWVRKARDLGLLSQTTSGKPSGGMVYAEGRSAGTSTASAELSVIRAGDKKGKGKK
jgi:hypothetical protein